MKQRKPAAQTVQGLLRHWPSVLVGGLALAGAAAQADTGVSPAAAASAAPAQTLYRVTNLGPAEAGVVINAKGQVAFTHGDPWTGVPPRAWFYDGTRLHALGTLGGNAIRTTDLNDIGQVAGIADTPSGLIHSFVWSLHHGMTDIGTLPGRNTAWEPAINNRGVVTGYSDSTSNPPYPHAFRWSARSGIEDLGVLLSGESSSSYGRAINDAGLIAGDAWAGESNYHAVVWTRAAGMVDIDTLGNHSSSPVAVGAKGEVAGNASNPPDNYGSVFRWTQATGMRDLGTATGVGSGMTAMSPGGRIAGAILFPDFSQHAMTWTAAGGMHDLGTLGGRSSVAFGANDKGLVVGAAVTAQDRFHAFVWTEKDGLVDLNKRLYHAPTGLELASAVGISDTGAIVAQSNAGLVLLRPMGSCTCTHAAGPIVSADMVALGAPVDAAIGFATEDGAARYDVAWAWGDGTAERARGASVSRGNGGAQARHSYSAPGIYTVTADVTDQAGNSAKAARRIVVYEASGGAVAGAGTVVVPAMRSVRTPVHGGAAHFSFVTPPAAKAKSASAKGYFLFGLPGFAFASDDVRVASTLGARAQLVGTGTVNGMGGYRFTAATAAASGTDTPGRFALKIWHTDPATHVDIVDYDSQGPAGGSTGHPLAAGSIVVQ